MNRCKKKSCEYVRERYRVLIRRIRELELSGHHDRDIKAKCKTLTDLNEKLCRSARAMETRVIVLNSIIERQELLLIKKEANRERE